jgi:hypothetical protein
MNPVFEEEEEEVCTAMATVTAETRAIGIRRRES